jgi:hypothetical protein
VLHALVTLKSRTIKRGTVKLPKVAFEAEVYVPLRDGDNLTLVLIMAIAEADEGENLLRLPRDDYRRPPTSCCRSAWTSGRRTDSGRECDGLEVGDSLSAAAPGTRARADAGQHGMPTLSRGLRRAASGSAKGSRWRTYRRGHKMMMPMMIGASPRASATQNLGSRRMSKISSMLREDSGT